MQRLIGHLIESANRTDLNKVMSATKNSYRRGEYGDKKWRVMAEYLLGKFSVDQTIDLMNSKIMRHAMDHAESNSVDDLLLSLQYFVDRGVIMYLAEL
jgi:hypothetical protein